MRLHWLPLTLAAALLAPPAAAQPTRFEVAVGPSYVHAAGTLGSYLGGGYGAGASLTLGTAHQRVRWHLQGDYLHYPATTRSRPYRLGTPAVIATGSAIIAATAGPRLGMAVGPVRFSAGAGAGLARVTTTGSVSVGTIPRLNRSTSFDDLTYAAALEGGAAVRLCDGRTTVWLDLSARRLWTGPSRWLREGNLPTGTISGVYLNPTWSVAAMWAARLAVVVGLSH